MPKGHKPVEIMNMRMRPLNRVGLHAIRVARGGGINIFVCKISCLGIEQKMPLLLSET